jgi:hypothetical protein
MTRSKSKIAFLEPLCYDRVCYVYATTMQPEPVICLTTSTLD